MTAPELVTFSREKFDERPDKSFSEPDPISWAANMDSSSSAWRDLKRRLSFVPPAANSGGSSGGAAEAKGLARKTRSFSLLPQAWGAGGSSNNSVKETETVAEAADENLAELAEAAASATCMAAPSDSLEHVGVSFRAADVSEAAADTAAFAVDVKVTATDLSNPLDVIAAIAEEPAADDCVDAASLPCSVNAVDPVAGVDSKKSDINLGGKEAAATKKRESFSSSLRSRRFRG